MWPDRMSKYTVIEYLCVIRIDYKKMSSAGLCNIANLKHFVMLRDSELGIKA